MCKSEAFFRRETGMPGRRKTESITITDFALKERIPSS